MVCGGFSFLFPLPLHSPPPLPRPIMIANSGGMEKKVKKKKVYSLFIAGKLDVARHHLLFFLCFRKDLRFVWGEIAPLTIEPLTGVGEEGGGKLLPPPLGQGGGGGGRRGGGGEWLYGCQTFRALMMTFLLQHLSRLRERERERESNHSCHHHQHQHHPEMRNSLSLSLCVGGCPSRKGVSSKLAFPPQPFLWNGNSSSSSNNNKSGGRDHQIWGFLCGTLSLFFGKLRVGNGKEEKGEGGGGGLLLMWQ